MENQIKLVKLGLATGLVSKRNNSQFNIKNFSSYFINNQSTADKIRILIRSGVYDIRKPDIESKIREDWYQSPSAITPTKIMKEELKVFNRMHKPTIIDQPMIFNKQFVSKVKKMFEQRRKEQRKQCKKRASVKI